MLEGDQVASLVAAGQSPGVLKEHEGQQSARLVVGEQPHHDPREPDRLDTQIPSQEPDHRTRGESHPCMQRQRRMAAGEDERQALVRKVGLAVAVGELGGIRHRHLPQLRRLDGTPSQDVQRAVAGCGGEPGTGRSGMPSVGHRASARRNASCAQSSARSQSPVSRISVARTRPPLLQEGAGDGRVDRRTRAGGARHQNGQNARSSSAPILAMG